MRRSSFFVLLILLGALTHPSFSPTVARAEPKTPASPRPVHTVSFELYRNLIFVPVTINGSKPLSFIVDSGSGICMIDRTRAAELRLKIEPGGKAIGLGEGTFDYELTRDVAFTTADVAIPADSARVVDLSPMRLVFGRPVEGALGYEFFARHVVEVDYEKKTLSLYDPKTYRYSGPGEKLSLTIKNNVPYLTGMLKLTGLEAVERTYLIDTGAASGTVSDNLVAESTGRKLAIVTGVGLGRETPGWSTRVERLQFGSVIVEDTIGRTGKPILGGAILSRLKLVFDYPRSQLFVEPNSRFAEPYLLDASGLGLRLASDLKHLRIHFVLSESPAAEAGLRPDDLITAIDGQPADKLDLTDVQHRLLKQAGKEVRLDMLRGNERFQVTVKLRKLL